MKFIYAGNRDAANSATTLTYGDQVVSVGGTIELSDEDAARIAPYFVLDPVAAVRSAGDDTLAPKSATSGTEGNLGGQSAPSATSKKS
jgi:hypothetical protein